MGQPSSNNCLESTNRIIKTNQLRERLSISKFGESCLTLLSNWSKDRAKEDQKFKKTYSFKDETWKLADHFLFREKGIIKKLGESENFILTRKNQNLITDNFVEQNFENIDLDFDSFIETCRSVHVVKFQTEQWSAKSSCSCYYFLKKYHCYHLFVIAVNKKIISIPSVFKNVPIGQKPKPGRKKKDMAGHGMIREIF